MNDNMSRIVNNIKTLLINGQFNGGAAPAIAEALSFLDALTAQDEKNDKEAKADDSDRDEKDAARLPSGGNGNRRRQGRKAKGK
jgi:hypothetical protein